MAKFEKISGGGSGSAGGGGGSDGGGDASTDDDNGGGSGGGNSSTGGSNGGANDDVLTGGGSGGGGVVGEKISGGGSASASGGGGGDSGGDVSTGGGSGGGDVSTGGDSGGGDALTGRDSGGGGGDVWTGGGGVVGKKKCKKARKRKTYSGYIVMMVIWFVLLETVKPPLGLFSGVVEPELWVIWGRPCCMFFLMNIIIVILALSSGMFSNAACQNGGLDFYSEFIRKSAERRAKYETGGSVTGGATKNRCSQSGKTKSQSAWMCSRSSRPAKNTLEGRCKGGSCGL